MKLEFIIDKISTQLEETQNKLNIKILEDIKRLSIENEFEKMENAIEDLEDKNEEIEDKIIKLENIVDKIGSIPIDIKHATLIQKQNQTYLSLNSTEFIDLNQREMNTNYKLLKSFYCLKKIKLTNVYVMHSQSNIANNGNNNTNIIFENSTVEILIFDISIQNAQLSITSLEGLQNLPSIHTLEFHNCIRLTESHNIIPFLHKNIKRISFFNCGTTTKGFLSKYCLDNDIELNYIESK